MRIFTLSLSIILSLFMLSCGTESTPIYTLSTTVVGDGTITPSGGEYEKGEIVTLSGTPAEHWVFNHWSGGGNGNTNTLSITMDSDKKVVGNFSERLYPLNITVEGEGSVSEDVIQNKSEYSVDTVVQLTSKPVDGWVFHNWSGDIEGIDNPHTIDINEGKEVTSVFKSIDQLLTSEISGEGTITIQQESFENHPSRRKVTLTPVPANGWKFVEWSGWDDDVDEENRIIVTLDEEKNVTVKFERSAYPLTITIEGEGTVEQEVVQSKTAEYPYETLVQLTPTPSGDYEFVEWSGDISSTEDVVTVPMDGEVNVTATFRHVLDGRKLQQINGSIHEETNYPSPETKLFSTTWEFDSSENLMNYVSYDSDESVSYRDTFTYDSGNNLTEQIRYGSDDLISFKITYTYDSNNNVTEQIYYDSNGSVSVRFTYSYDTNNNLSERILYNSSGTVSLKNTYIYDSSNKLTDQIYYHADGSVIGKDTFTYDSNNNLIEQVYYGSDNSILGRDTLTYDSGDNLIKWEYNSDTSNWTTVYEYDFNGHQTYVYDVYNFLLSEHWYKTITTENRENIYHERSSKINKKNRSTLNSKNHQLIWELNRLNRNYRKIQYPNRDFIETLNLDFLPNHYFHQPIRIY